MGRSYLSRRLTTRNPHRWDHPVWSASLDLILHNYTLSFSNTTASMSLLTTMKGSTLNLAFSGQRSPNNSIELDTSDPSKPQFRYDNGSNFYFHNNSGFWQVAATEFQSTIMESALTATGAEITSFGFATGSAATAKATTSSTSGASAAGLRPPILVCVLILFSFSSSGL